MNEKAREYALRILERRDVSRKMLIDRLTEKGVTPEDAAETADWLCGLGVVDDGKYAGMVVRHYAAKGYGERRIREELYRCGIPRELWEEALEQMPATDDALDALLRDRLRGEEPTPDVIRKISGALQRRGYSWEEIHAAVERCGAREE